MYGAIKNHLQQELEEIKDADYISLSELLLLLKMQLLKFLQEKRLLIFVRITT